MQRSTDDARPQGDVISSLVRSRRNINYADERDGRAVMDLVSDEKTRPVRLIAPVAPAGAPDIFARLMGQWLSERLGQQFVIENRPGGGNNIGTEAVVHAPADGYTLLMAATPNAVNATLYDKLSFNFLRDIAPVASGWNLTLGALV